MTADELWDKHASDTDGLRFLMRQDDFLAALKEYGEHVKSEAVKVCASLQKKADDFNRTQPSWSGNYQSPPTSADCAAAIEKMELP